MSRIVKMGEKRCRCANKKVHDDVGDSMRRLQMLPIRQVCKSITDKHRGRNPVPRYGQLPISGVPGAAVPVWEVPLHPHMAGD
jgi:hypothetical protein